MIIKVTKEDIKQGKPGMPCHCPVARAMNRHVFERVSVTGRMMSREVRGRLRWLPISDEVKEWIRNYDRGAPVKPFSFHIPDHWGGGVGLW